MTDSLNTDISDELISAQDGRNEVDVLLMRVNLLRGPDRALMKMYFEQGSSYGQIAALLGVDEYKISRRIRRITKRLMDGRYLICLRNRASFSAFEMAIAKDYFVRGLSIKKIAQKRRSSFYATRMVLLDIEARLRRIEGGIQKTDDGRQMTEDR